MKSYVASPELAAELERRMREKHEGPPIRKWQRNMNKEQFLQALAEGQSKEEIVLKHFNNDPRELKKQLEDWELTEKEAAELAKVAKPIELTKEQYLQRRLNGETRTRIINSLGIAKPRVYELLKQWGIRELDAEERELELLSPVNSVNERVAKDMEQKAEARADHQWSAEVVNELERTEAGEDILKRPEQRTATQEQELASLQAAVELWKNDAERKGEHIRSLEAEVERYKQSSLELETERQMLLQTIEQAAGTDASMIVLQIPIMPEQIAVLERTRIYSSLEALSYSIEGAEIDRKRVATELFDLLQRVVNFITADLVELLPGQDATVYIHEFFDYYNRQHIQSLTEIEQEVIAYAQSV